MSYTCPHCGRTSHNPTDAKERYCGACHKFAFERDFYHFILDENNVPQPATLTEQLEWMGSPAGRHTLAFTETDWHFVSTIFLHSNHNHSGIGPPILFETMAGTLETHDAKSVRGKIVQQHEWIEQERYASYDAAMAGHAAIVARVRDQEAHAAKETAAALDKSRVGAHGEKPKDG